MRQPGTSHSESSLVLPQDPLGERRREVAADGTPVDVLVVRPALAAVPSFEFAARERANRLGAFRHAYYLRVRGIERDSGPEAGLRIVSDATQGLRLSDLLREAEARRIPVDINAALCLIRQLVPAVAMLHESARDTAHGALGLERLLVTPSARLLIAEYVLGAAIEQLRYSRERYWSDLGIVVPPGSGPARFDHRTDVAQIGAVALSLILGRPLKPEEYPGRVADVVASTWAVSPRGGFEPLPPGLRGWLGRALQIEGARGFQSAGEARAELDLVLGANEQLASPASLEAFLSRLESSPQAVAVEPAGRRSDALPATQPEVAQVSRAAEPDFEEGADVEPVGPMRDLQAAATLDVADEPGGEPELVDQALQISDPWWRRWRVTGAAVAAVILLLAGGSLAARREMRPAESASASGTLAVTSEPSGAQTMIDGVLRGTTPLTLALEPGAHVLELRGAGEPRTFPVTISPGVQLSLHAELPKPSSRAVAESQERRTTDVASDPGPPVRPAASDPGWVSVTSSVDVQVLENGTAIGRSGERIELAPGRHDLSFANELVGLRSTQAVQVSSGRTTSITLPTPTGSLSVNAVPWAEVWIDGERIGETPIGNLSLPVGTHDVLFRHPELGERHQSTVVTTKEAARLSVDLSKP